MTETAIPPTLCTSFSGEISMDQHAEVPESYRFSTDENDAFDENLDLFDHLQYGEFEDGIASSNDPDEEEMEEEMEDDPSFLQQGDEKDYSSPSLWEMDDYDELED